MSQSNNSKDSQALLQSMLQRLRLQPGREGRAFLQSPSPVRGVSTPGKDKDRLVFNFPDSSPVNGFKSAADGNFGHKGGEIQQPSHDSEVDAGLISLPSQKDNADGDKGEKRLLGQGTEPAIFPTGKKQLFASKSLPELTSFKRTEKVSFGSSAVTNQVPSNKDAVPSMKQNLDLNQCFTPKIYTWSIKPTDAGPEAESEESKMLHMGNGGFEASAESKDVQFVASSQQTNSSFRRKQRTSENKTTRWTQKLKERWKDRQESFRKKGKKEGSSAAQKSEQVTEVSSQKQLVAAESMINTMNNEKERTLPSLDSMESSKTPPSLTEDGSSDRRSRSYSDFEFSLGSFSLLEEIVTGQEWAKFLNPNLSATSVSQRSSEEPLGQFKTPSNPDSVQSSVMSNQQEDGSNQWSLWSTERRPAPNFSMAQVSPVASAHRGSMEVSESVQREADQSEPMDDGHNRSEVQPREKRVGRRPPSILQLQPSDILEKNRGQISRKRHHQSAARGDEEEAGRERSLSALSVTSNHEMDETGSHEHDNIIPLCNLNSPTPLSPSAFNPFAPAPRGVLKHSISKDSQSSVETMIKRRRVEGNRRVRFSEDVVAIEPPEADLDYSDSEEDSEADDDSVLEQECEVEQAPVQEVAPARRHHLPAWIQALKRKNTGRKQR